MCILIPDLIFVFCFLGEAFEKNRRHFCLLSKVQGRRSGTRYMADFMETRSVYNLPSYEDAVPSLAPPLHGDESPPSVSTSSSDNIPFPVDATINRKLCWFEGAGHHVEADVLLIGKSEIVTCVGNNGRARRGTTCFPFTSSNQAVTSFFCWKIYHRYK